MQEEGFCEYPRGGRPQRLGDFPIWGGGRTFNHTVTRSEGVNSDKGRRLYHSYVSGCDNSCLRHYSIELLSPIGSSIEWTVGLTP